MSFVRLWALCILVGTAPACIRTPAAPTDHPRTYPVNHPFVQDDAPFRYERTVLDLEPGESWWTSELRFPAAHRGDPENPEVRAVVRQPSGGEARGLIVVLPVLTGDYGASDGFARSLTEAGFTSVRLDRKRDLFDPDGDFDLVIQRMTQTVVDLRRVLDWAEATAVPGSDHVGLLGISMGSLIGTLAAATDERIDATVLIMGGASLVEILDAASGNGVITRFFEGLEARGWDRERILEEAHAHLDPVDPVRYAPHLDPRTTLLVYGRFDRVIPYENGTLLWEAAGRPERIVVPVGHYTAWMVLPYLHTVTGEHFTRHLR